MGLKEEKNMKYMMISLGVFIFSLIAYIGLWMGVSAGQILFLAYLMMPVSLVMVVSLVLTVVFFIIKK